MYSHSQFIRNLTRLVLWCLATAFALFLNFSAFTANLLATSSALELSGYEKQALIDDVAFGDILGAVMPNGTMAHLLAIVITGGIALAMFFVAHLLNMLYMGYEERRVLRRQGNDEGVAQAERHIREQLFWLVLLVAPIVLVLQWDVALLIYRQIAYALGGESLDTGEVAGMLPHWDHLEAAAANLAAVRISQTDGAFGYLGMGMLVPMSLELCFHKLAQALSQLLRPWETTPTLDASSAPERVENGQRVSQAETGRVAEKPEQPLESVAEYAGADVSPVQASTVPENPGTANDAPQPVLGGRPGETVTLAEAQADGTRYHVDTDTRQVWARAYWKALHADTQA